MSRRLPALAVGLLVPALVASVVVAPAASASPAMVDSLISTIGTRVDQGRWRVVSMNIQDLDRTIYDALNNRKVPVAVARNPVATALSAVTARGKAILAEKAALATALNKLDRAEAGARPGALALIFTEMYRELSLIKPTYGLPDVVDLPDGTVATEVVRTLKAIKTTRARVAYMKELVASLQPAIREVTAVRAQLLPLNRQLNAVLAKYGIKAGGPAVRPPTPTTTHPAIAGVWTETTGACPGARITFTQDGNGNVTSANDNGLASCGAAWTASNITWESSNVLTYSYAFTTRPSGWLDGRHRVVFSADGRTATMTWTAGSDSGTVPLSRA